LSVDCVSNVSLDCENGGHVTNCVRRAQDGRFFAEPVAADDHSWLCARIHADPRDGARQIDPSAYIHGERATLGRMARMARSLLDDRESMNGSLA
jgi:hypothetical protein